MYFEKDWLFAKVCKIENKNRSVNFSLVNFK